MQLDAGIFILLLGSGIGATLLAFRLGTMLAVIGAMLFLVLGVIMMGEPDIAYIVTSSDGTVTTTETHYIVGDGDASTTENTQWIGWLFILIGVILSFSFLTQMFTRGF